MPLLLPTDSVLYPRKTLYFLENTSVNFLATSSSSSGESTSCRCMMFIFVPSEPKKWASSAAMYPPPIIVSVGGCFFSLRASSLVIKPVPSSPFILGIAGRVPDAIRIFWAFISWPPTEIVFSPTNLPSCGNSFGLSISENARLMPSESESTMLFVLLTIFSKSTEYSLTFMPNCPAPLIVSATSALCISSFEGMQPRLRHVPPILAFSIIATRRPSCATAFATSRPEPLPMTIKSNSRMIHYLLQFR